MRFDYQFCEDCGLQSIHLIQPLSKMAGILINSDPDQIIRRKNKKNSNFQNLFHNFPMCKVLDSDLKEFVSEAHVNEGVKPNLDKCSKLGF